MAIQNPLRTHPKKNWFALIALLAVPLSGLNVDINVPSLPAISHYYHVGNALAQLTITAYMIGFGVSQLFAGSICDSVGRKKPFIAAMVVFIAATFLAPISYNIYQLLALRFIQGCAVAYSSVPMRAMISDLFEGKEFYKMANYMVMAWALGPIIAPAIGGYLQTYFGWQAPFYFLGTYAIALLASGLIFLPETLHEKQPLNIKTILNSYRQLLTHKQYVSGLFCLGFLYSFLVLFGVMGAFLIQKTLHYSAIQFGQMTLCMGLAWFLGNITNRFLINVNPEQKISICFWLMLIGVCVMSVVTLFTSIHIYNILIPTFYLLYMGGTAFPNYFAKSIALFPQIAASASALMGAFMALIAGAAAGFSSLLKSNTQIPLTMTYGALVLICLIVFYWGKEANSSLA